MKTIVVLGREETRARLVAEALKGSFAELDAAPVWDGFQLGEVLRRGNVLTIVCDGEVTWAPRPRLLAHLAQVVPETPIIVWGEDPDPRAVLEVLRMGATDYLWGGWPEARMDLVHAIARATGAWPDEGRAARIIPLRRPQDELRQVREESAATPSEGPRVLIADASVVLLGMLGQLVRLRIPGVVVRRCTDAVQLEDALREHQVDVVCCASDLPGLSADSLRAQLCCHAAPPSVVLWTVSGHSRDAFGGVPKARFRSKPIDGRTLVDDLQELTAPLQMPRRHAGVSS